MMVRCRSCGVEAAPLESFLLQKMPKSAQDFPNADALDSESGKDLLIFACPYCGLVQAAGEPVHYYRDVIRAVSVSDEMRAFRRKQFSAWVSSRHLTGKRVIEIGCGTGEFLEIMRETGADARGLEHGGESVRSAVEKGNTVYQGFLETENSVVPGGPYDGFYSLNFLEHIPAPRSFLRSLHHNLVNGAAGLIEVPNLDMILRNDLYSEFIQDHLSYFTKDSFGRILSECGFEVLKIEEIWSNYILSAEVTKRHDFGLTHMEEHLRKRKVVVSEYLRQQKDTVGNIAAWGAGHQALANFSLLGIDRYLDCVIDSAAFKQNKFTPATHLPVVSPEILQNGTIKSVLITAGGYAKEICSFLESNYPDIHIAILGEHFEIVK